MKPRVSSNHYPVKWFLLCLALALLTSCAVLTVDVDVYKGPLSNHESMQTEQLAAMAIGAKPLLFSLRDEAEQNWNQEKVKQMRTNSWYRYAFIPFDNNRKSRFTNDLAVRVNAILSLYENRPAGEFNALMLEARRALGKYETAYSIFHRTTNQDVAAIKGLPLDHHPLGRAYKDLMVQSNMWRTETNIFKVLPEATNGWAKLTNFFGDLPPAQAGPNAHFAALQDPELLNLHASIIFPNQKRHKEQRAKFMDEVSVIGRSFFEARQALSDLLRSTLDIVEIIGTQASTNVERAVQIQQAAKMAASLVKPDHLLLVLGTDWPDPDFKNAMAGLKTNLLTNGLSSAMISDGTKVDSKVFSAALQRSLLASPAVAAYQLRLADQAYRDHNFHPPANFNAYAALPINRQFGLAHGPTSEVTDELNRRELTQNLNSISPSSEGLASGRLEDGVQKLIEDYLKASRDHQADDHQVQVARKRLLEGLIGFAEKIKFIADSEALISKNSNLEEWIKLIGYTWAWTLPPPLNPHSHNGGFHRTKEQIFVKSEDYIRAKPYTLVLQAIGNSILSQINELAEGAAYKDKLAKTIKVEQDALTATTNFLHLASVSNLSNALPYTAALQGVTNSIDAMDRLIKTLRNIQILATSQGQTNLAQDVEAAVKLATVYRANYVYIRPPSAFLRNSFPATSLQRDANIAWKNMLDRHVWRSLPWPFGETFANWGTEVNTVKEIDKQYWQNINRVRVASAGISSYAITKDDIGNWYVQTYTGDPSPIIDGVKNFAVAGAISPASSKAAEVLAAQKQESSNAAPQDVSLLQKQFEHFAAIYQENTTNQAAMTLNLATNLLFRITNGLELAIFTNELTVLTNNYNFYVTNASSRLSEVMKDPKKQPAPSVIGKETIQAFKGLDSYKWSLYGQLTNSTLRSQVTNVLEADLKDLVRTRLNDVRSFESAIRVLTEAATP